MRLLSNGEQFVCNYDFGRHTLKFEGKVDDVEVYRHADAPHNNELVVRKMCQWYGTGHTDITELRHNGF